jgi:Holliday junction resolvase-like predicted endonuclease
MAETIAVGFLVSRGVVIVDRNRRVGRGEVDILAIAEGERTVVEVRSVNADPDRGPLPPPHPLDAFDRAKAQQVRRLANALRCPRVDLVAVRIHRSGVDLHWVKRVA